MDFVVWTLVWLLVGTGLFGLLWKWMRINWSGESTGIKVMLIVTPVAWPLVLLLFLFVLVFKR